MKKTFVLVVLFVLPIVAYLFFASGVNNFGRLPIVTPSMSELPKNDEHIQFLDHITVLGFLGSDVGNHQGNAFNLNQKIYKRFSDFKDFQFVMVLPKGAETEVQDLKKELSGLSDTKKWQFLFLETAAIENIFYGLNTNLNLDGNYYTPYVFIIDKDKNLRGRTKDDAAGIKYGYNTTSVADLNNKMEDDVKIILAEYRLALKKNNKQREY